MTNSKNLGSWGENIAQNYLQNKGYNFITKNHKEGRLELDLIFKRATLYIFVEVKTRNESWEQISDNYLSCRQTNNLKKAIISYCLKYKINFENTRLDLILITVNYKTKIAKLKHYLDIL